MTRCACPHEASQGKLSEQDRISATGKPWSGDYYESVEVGWTLVYANTPVGTLHCCHISPHCNTTCHQTFKWTISISDATNGINFLVTGPHGSKLLYQIQPLDTILNQFYLPPILTAYFPTIYLRIILLSLLSLSNGCFPKRFPTWIMYKSPIPIQPRCLDHHNLLHCTTLETTIPPPQKPSWYYTKWSTGTTLPYNNKGNNLIKGLILTPVPRPFCYRWTAGWESPHWNMTHQNLHHSWHQFASNSYPVPVILPLQWHRKSHLFYNH